MKELSKMKARERKRKRERERGRDRQTDRQTDRQKIPSVLPSIQQQGLVGRKKTPARDDNANANMLENHYNIIILFLSHLRIRVFFTACNVLCNNIGFY